MYHTAIPPVKTMSSSAGPVFSIHSAVPGARVRREFMLTCARHAARHIRRKISSISFVLVDDRKMSALHRQYLNIGGTTDVITFDLSESPRGSLEGEIYICINQARRQAEEYRVPLYLEVARLAIHGVLHLAGYDDNTPAHRERMHLLENRTLQQMRPGQ
jgi:probable rRNA maturation factor